MAPYIYQPPPSVADIIPEFPAWCPQWLAKMVEEPNCTPRHASRLCVELPSGWSFYLPPAECPGAGRALVALRSRQMHDPGVPDDAELNPPALMG